MTPPLTAFVLSKRIGCPLELCRCVITNGTIEECIQDAHCIAMEILISNANGRVIMWDPDSFRGYINHCDCCNKASFEVFISAPRHPMDENASSISESPAKGILAA